MIGTSTASLTDPLLYSDDERRALYTQQLLRLWEALKADHWLISTISEAHVTEPTTATINGTNNEAYTSSSSTIITPPLTHTTSAHQHNVTTTNNNSSNNSGTNDNNKAPIKPKAVSPWQQFKNTLIATRTPSSSPPPIYTNSQSSSNQQSSFSMPRWNRVSSISEDGEYYY